MVDTLEGCGRIGRSVWLALEESQSSAQLQAAGVASRLAQVGSEVGRTSRCHLDVPLARTHPGIPTGGPGAQERGIQCCKVDRPHGLG